MASVSLLYRRLVAASWRHFPHVQRSGTSKPISNTWAPSCRSYPRIVTSSGKSNSISTLTALIATTPPSEKLPDDPGHPLHLIAQPDAANPFFPRAALKNGRAIAIVTYNVQVPLERAAIQVKLFGPRDRE